jgi:hypothetical protein
MPDRPRLNAPWRGAGRRDRLRAGDIGERTEAPQRSARQRHLESFAALASRVSTRLDRFGHAEWQQAIDALQIGAIVQPSMAEGTRTG